MCYKHTMECHSAIKGTKCAICRDVDRPREGPTEWSKSEEKSKCPFLVYVSVSALQIDSSAPFF